MNPRLRDIRRFGCFAMAYSHLQDGIEEYRHESFDGFIGYALRNKCSFILSNPVTSRNDYRKATELFLKEHPHSVVCQATQEYSEVLKNIGFYVTGLGVDNCIDLGTFAVNARIRPNLHRFFTRVKNLGFAVVEEKGDIEQLRAINQEWLGVKQNKREFQFLARPFVSNSEEDVRLFLLKKDDSVFGFCSFDPLYNGGSNNSISNYVIQHIRINKDAPRGATDFLVISVLKLLASEGLNTASLGLSLLHQRFKPSKRKDIIIEFLLDNFYKYSKLYKCRTIGEHKDRYHADKQHAYLAFIRRHDIKGVVNILRVNGLM